MCQTMQFVSPGRFLSLQRQEIAVSTGALASCLRESNHKDDWSAGRGFFAGRDSRYAFMFGEIARAIDDGWRSTYRLISDMITQMELIFLDYTHS